MGGSEAGKLRMGMEMETLKLVNNLYSVLHTYTSRINESDIADTGASGHYMKSDATHELAIRPVAPIQVNQRSGQILQYTKGCRLVLKTLPEGAREAQILQRLAHSYLSSIGDFFDSGCAASVNQHTMAVTKDKQVVLQGTRGIMKSLWRVPLQIFYISTQQSNNIYQINDKEMPSSIYMRRILSRYKTHWKDPLIGASSIHGMDSRKRHQKDS